MSSKALRQWMRVGLHVSATLDDTMRRVAYAMPARVGVGEPFLLRADWGRALPIFGGLPALSARSMRRRLSEAVRDGLLAIDGRTLRLVLPGMVPDAVQTSRRGCSAAWLDVRDNVVSYADAVAKLRPSSGQTAAKLRPSSGHGSLVSDCNVIEIVESKAEGEGNSSAAPSGSAAVSLSAGASFEPESAATEGVVFETEEERRARFARASALVAEMFGRNASAW